MKQDPLDVLAAQRGTSKPITAAVNAWRNNGAVYEKEAVRKVQAAMRRDLLTFHRSASEGRMRPSSIGVPCPRYQALSFSGFEKLPFSEVSLGFMDAGTWAHYQWQAMLLSAYIQGFGGLTNIEVKVNYRPWMLSGSMDGIQDSGELFELKTTGYYKYHGGKYAAGQKNSADPKLDHLQQFMGYMAAKKATAGSIVYLSRDNNNDFIEYRVEWDQAVFDAKDREMKATLAGLKKGNLPVMLESCYDVHTGASINLSREKKAEAEGIFDRCDFHHICPKAVL